MLKKKYFFILFFIISCSTIKLTEKSDKQYDTLSNNKLSFLKCNIFKELENRNILIKLSKNFFYFGSVSDTDTVSTIKQIFNDYKIVIDPHTAVGISLGRSILGSENLNTYLATAHYGKFIDTINESLNRKVDLPKRLKSLKQKEEKFKVIENNLDLIENYISKNI